MSAVSAGVASCCAFAANACSWEVCSESEGATRVVLKAVADAGDRLVEAGDDPAVEEGALGEGDVARGVGRPETVQAGVGGEKGVGVPEREDEAAAGAWEIRVNTDPQSRRGRVSCLEPPPSPCKMS